MAFRVSFFGGADAVTGSEFLVESGDTRILIDCGIEQGKDFCESCMYDEFPYDLERITAVVVTHAHLDHIGRVPKLVKDGYAGPIYMTEPTRDIADVMLRDSAHIMSENAKAKQLPPLYLEEHVNKMLSQIEVVEYRKEMKVGGMSMMLRDTGHILGGASIRLKDGDGDTIAFTSDIGNSPTPLLPDAEAITDADAVVIESVYGDRANPEKEHRVEKFRDTVKAAIARKGPILIPAFSVERTQLMLYELSNLMEAGALPRIPVFLDSPLAIAVTDIYKKHAAKYFKDAAQDELKREHDLFAFPFLKMTPSREESQQIVDTKDPKIIIAGAGMSHGGRIGKWEKMFLPKPQTTLIMVGYQAPGSPGRLLQDGSKKVKIAGQMVEVRAKVETLHGWSGHADRDGLLRFADSCVPSAKTFFVAMGEPSSARFLAQRIHDFLGVRAIVAGKNEVWEVSKKGVTRQEVRGDIR
ncbi:MBL fold metallo-hydrolase [Patescibacteria group bacterium]|nr:MBL fold metallo-hydrolase [Patescibacteria group bacterium]